MKHAELVEEAKVLGLDPKSWDNLALVLNIYLRGKRDGRDEMSKQWMDVIDERKK